jgi:hypothetical protein
MSAIAYSTQKYFELTMERQAEAVQTKPTL